MLWIQLADLLKYSNRAVITYSINPINTHAAENKYFN